MGVVVFQYNFIYKTHMVGKYWPLAYNLAALALPQSDVDFPNTFYEGNIKRHDLTVIKHREIKD